MFFLAFKKDFKNFFYLSYSTLGAPEAGGPERRLGRPGGPRALEGGSRWPVAQNEASSQHALQPDAIPSACSSGDNDPVILQASNKEPGSGTMQSSPSSAHPQLPVLQTQVWKWRGFLFCFCFVDCWLWGRRNVADPSYSSLENLWCSLRWTGL